jgi:uncharacterized protein
MRVVFDTNVLLSSTLWEGSVAQKLLFKLILADVKIYASPEILEEYQKVLNRDFDYSCEDVSRISEKVLSFVTLITPKETINVVKEDSADNKIIECAIESSAGYIVTYDKHLLSIGKYRGVIMIRPEEAMVIVK